MKKSIIIYGPTAVGKSAVAVELAKKIDAEIISADSMQIYKDLNIGSAKVTEEEMQGIKHYLINIKNSLDSYSVYDFCNDCNECIKQIKARNKNVIIVGGTGLYLKALTENYNCGNCDKNETLRNELEQKSLEELQDILKEKSIDAFNKIDVFNKVRLIRAIEVISNGGELKNSTFDDENFIIFGLIDDREKIYNRINNRVESMIKNGLIEETKYLINHGATIDSQCMKAIGYKELLPYINGECELNKCVETLKQKTRNYAKRQFTYMNQFPSLIKVPLTTVVQTANEIFENIKGQNNE